MSRARAPSRTARVGLAALAVLLLAAVLAAPARAPPAVPMRVDGTASDASASPLPAGTRIRATVDGVDYSNGSAVHDGAGGFSLLVDGNSRLAGASDSPEIKEGADPAEDIVFVAGDPGSAATVFVEVLPWQEGATRVQDLTLAAAGLQPAEIKIQGLLPRPAQGGPQSAFVCNPTGSAVDLGGYYLELNRPGIVHGPRFDLAGTLAPGATLRVDVGTSFLTPTGDAAKLVFENPGGAGAPAGGADVVVDRVEFNATTGGTLSWEPGNTILGDAPAPRPGFVLERAVLCVDADSPSDFRLVPEPGLPPNGPPSVGLDAPSAGATLPGGAPFTIRWTMADDVFLEGYLLVWVNVSVGGTNTSVLAGAEGTTSVVWNVPDLQAADVIVTVEVSDPYGERAVATGGPFSIARSTPFDGSALVVALVLVGVVLGFLLLAFLFRRRGSRPPARPAMRPPAAPPPSAGPAPPPTGPVVPSERTKTCPRCGTAVFERDWTCFFCGFRFPGPP
ncbi:MAG TPA: hypothetical protein VJ326_04475 [Thermoplasmata archaeon]|nr:hypothetical protein [Thermoplasmata archaeon]